MTIFNYSAHYLETIILCIQKNKVQLTKWNLNGTLFQNVTILCSCFQWISSWIEKYYETFPKAYNVQSSLGFIFYLNASLELKFDEYTDLLRLFVNLILIRVNIMV